MKRIFSAKPLIAAAIALGALGATSMAQARDDVRFTIAVGEPHGQYHQYHQYRQPAPVYRGYDRFDHDRFGPMGDADRDGVPNRFDRAPRNPRRY